MIKILTEMEESLGRFTMDELRKAGVQIILSNKVKDIIGSNQGNLQDSSSKSRYNNLEKSPLGSLLSINMAKMMMPP